MQRIAYDTFLCCGPFNKHISAVPDNKTPYNVLEENNLNISWSEASFSVFSPNRVLRELGEEKEGKRYIQNWKQS
jgi:hypothetical protein